MAKTIELPIPDELHETLVSRAEKAGLSVADYLLREISAVMAQPSVEELLARLHSRVSIDLEPTGAADLVREGREERGRQMDAWFDDRR